MMSFGELIKSYFDSPEISKNVEYFGSIETKTNDKYSDIDIRITPTNNKKFYLNFLNILKSINEYYVVFPVIVDKNPQVFTVIWKGRSLYKKLDLRINSNTDLNLIKNSCQFDEKLRPFYSFYIGAIRFTKHRKRNELTASMKFYRSAHEYLMRICSSQRLLHKYFFLTDDMQINTYFIEILKKYLQTSLLNKSVKKKSIDCVFAENVIKFTQNELLGTRH